MNILFIHQNFPAQFIHLSQALALRGHQVRALAIKGQSVPGVTLENYTLPRGNTPNIHPYAIEFETKVIRADACAQKMIALKEGGFEPELIVAHPGWGESIFCKQIFPNAKLVHFIEFHYGKGLDIGFDTEFQVQDLQDTLRMSVKDSGNLLSLDLMDLGICPTRWQLSSVPDYHQSRIELVFDGIDTDIVAPNPKASVNLKGARNEKNFCVEDEVLTFVNRNLEPYRGYHSFMRSLPKIMNERPNANVIIVGGNEVSYGKPPAQGNSWKEIFLEEIKDQVDLSRIFFVGKIPYKHYLALMQVSRCHVYLTYPFVMSWSAVEALAAGSLVVGSDTPPVREFIQDQENGLLVNFFDYDQIANTVIDCLANPEKYQHLRIKAREGVVEKYDLKRVCLPKQISILSDLMGQPL